MQTKLDNVKEKVEQFLNKKKIKFSVSPCPVEGVDGQKHTGYNFETDNILGSVIPNYNTNRVEFILLNQNMVNHLVEEGYSDKEISESGKVWIHIEKLSSFKKMLELSPEDLK